MQKLLFAQIIGVILFSVGLRLTCLAQKPAFPIQVSENGRYFIDQNGKPFLYHADTGWQIFTRLTHSEAKEYLVMRKQQGFNTFQVQLSPNPDSANRSGLKPFRDYDFSNPNEAYFGHVEKVIHTADSLGLLLNIAPFWAGCCKEAYGIGSKVEMYSRNGIEKSRKLGQWIGKRFEKYKNIVWTVGGDRDPESIRKEIEALAEGLHTVTPYQLITFHAMPPHSSTDLYQYAPWLGFSMIYTYWPEKPNDFINPDGMPHVYQAANKEYSKTDRIPFILGEAQYEGVVNLIEFPKTRNDIGTPHIVRRQAYWTILSGGSGHAYGNDGWFFPKNWREIMKYPGAIHMGHFITFMQSIPWWELVPDMRHQILLADYGEYTKANYVTAATSKENKLFVAYIPFPGPLTVDMSKLKGPQVSVKWYNPRAGTYIAGGSFSNTGVKKLYSPLQEDWVLVLESQ